MTKKKKFCLLSIWILEFVEHAFSSLFLNFYLRYFNAIFLNTSNQFLGITLYSFRKRKLIHFHLGYGLPFNTVRLLFHIHQQLSRRLNDGRHLLYYLFIVLNAIYLFVLFHKNISYMFINTQSYSNIKLSLCS